MADETIYELTQETAIDADDRFIVQDPTGAGSTRSTSATFALIGGMAIDETYNTAADHTGPFTGAVGNLYAFDLSAMTTADFDFKLPASANVSEYVGLHIMTGPLWTVDPDARKRIYVYTAASGDEIENYDYSSDAFRASSQAGFFFVFQCVANGAGTMRWRIAQRWGGEGDLRDPPAGFLPLIPHDTSIDNGVRLNALLEAEGLGVTYHLPPGWLYIETCIIQRRAGQRIIGGGYDRLEGIAAWGQSQGQTTRLRWNRADDPSTPAVMFEAQSENLHIDGVTFDGNESTYTTGTITIASGVVTLSGGTFPVNQIKKITFDPGGGDETYNVEFNTMNFARTSCTLVDLTVNQVSPVSYTATYNGAECGILFRNRLNWGVGTSKSLIERVQFLYLDIGTHAAPRKDVFTDGVVSVTSGVVTLSGTAEVWPDTSLTGGGVATLGANEILYSYVGQHGKDTITFTSGSESGNTYYIKSRDSDTQLTLEDLTVSGVSGDTYSVTRNAESNTDNVTVRKFEYNGCEIGHYSDNIQSLSWSFSEGRIYNSEPCRVAFWVSAGGAYRWYGIDVVRDGMTFLKIGKGSGGGDFQIMNLQGDAQSTDVVWVDASAKSAEFIIEIANCNFNGSGDQFIFDRVGEARGDSVIFRNCSGIGSNSVVITGANGWRSNLVFEFCSNTIDSMIDTANSNDYQARQIRCGGPGRMASDREIITL